MHKNGFATSFLVYLTPLVISVLLVIVIWNFSVRVSGPLLAVAAANLSLLGVLYFYGTHNLLSAFWTPRLPPPPPLAALGHLPRVAILVAVKNDIEEAVIRAATRIRYPGDKIKLYICDDSDEEHSKAEVDQISSRFEAQVIRRGDNLGGKPGNINNAAKQIDCDYFAILDSDVEVPEDFLEKSLGYFKDTSVAYVQCRHKAKNSDGSFSGLLGDGVNVFYERTMPRRAAYGITLALGHGLIIRKEAWKKVGGFPLSLADDFAFTIKVRMAGMLGIYNPYVECKEDFPADYHALRVRSERWQRGAWELFPQAVRARGLRVSEKADLILETFRPHLSNVFVLFIVTAIAGAVTGVIDLPIILTPFMFYSLSTSLGPYLRTLGLKRGLMSWGFATLVYNSTIFTTGKAVFFRQKGWRVTPKKKTMMGWISALRFGKVELLSGFLLFMGAILANAPIFMSVAIPAMTSIIFQRNPSFSGLGAGAPKPKRRSSIRGSAAGTAGMLMTFFILSLILLPTIALSGGQKGFWPFWPAAPATLPTEM